MQQATFFPVASSKTVTIPGPEAPMTEEWKGLEQYQTRAEWGRYFVSTVYHPGMKALEPTAGNGLGFCQWIQKDDLTVVEIHPGLAPAPERLRPCDGLRRHSDLVSGGLESETSQARV